MKYLNHFLKTATIASLFISSVLHAQFGGSFNPQQPAQCFYNARVKVNIYSPTHNSEVKGLLKVSASVLAEYNTNQDYRCNRGYGPTTTSYSIKGGPLDQKVTSSSSTLDVSELVSGDYTISVSATHTMQDGRKVYGSAGIKVKVIKDTEPPTLNITYPLDGQIVRGILQFKANAKDDSGIRDLHFFAGTTDLGVYESNEETISFDTRKFPDGLLLLQVKAVDNQNNPISASVTVDVDNVDDDPEISFVDLVDGQAVAGLINVETEVFDDVGIEFVKYYVDGIETNVDLAEPYFGLIDTEKFPDGPHQIAAIATDSKGETSSAFVEVIFQNGDFIDPFVQITSLVEGSRVQGELSIIAKAEDASGVEKVDFFIGAALVGTVDTPPYQFFYDTEQLPNGIYNFGVVAHDRAGNFNTDEVVLIVENGDNLNSSVFITSPQNDSTVNGVVELEALAVDNVAVREVRFLINDKIVGATKISPYGILFDTTGYPNGAYKLTVQALDYSGNKGEESINIDINNTGGNPFDDTSSNLTPKPRSLILGYSKQLIEQIDFHNGKRALSKDMQSEYKLAFQDLMGELKKTVRLDKKNLRKDKSLKSIPRLTRRANRKLNNSLKRKIKLRSLRSAKRKINRIIKLLEG